MSILDYIDSLQDKIEGLFVNDAGELVECSAPEVTSDDLVNPNVRAFLMCIRVCEGTAGPNGYRTSFGGKLFDDFSHHPQLSAPFTQTNGQTNTSTAAGAYQFMPKTWAAMQKALGLADFSPLNQDRAGVELVRRAKALEDVKAGNFVEALRKCSTVWMSLPFSTHPQPMKTVEYCRQAYLSNGGMIAE